VSGPRWSVNSLFSHEQQASKAMTASHIAVSHSFWRPSTPLHCWHMLCRRQLALPSAAAAAAAAATRDKLERQLDRVSSSSRDWVVVRLLWVIGDAMPGCRLRQWLDIFWSGTKWAWTEIWFSAAVLRWSLSHLCVCQCCWLCQQLLLKVTCWKKLIKICHFRLNLTGYTSKCICVSTAVLELVLDTLC